MDELTGGRGITFATGTPISNSMTELYTLMRYLQHDLLDEMGLQHFDNWAAQFGRPQPPLNWLRKEPATGQRHDSPASSIFRN